MSEIKTKQNDEDVFAFIEAFADTEQKKKDAYELVKIMEAFTGYPPKMWGASIIGFGSYHYKSNRSKQEGDWPIVGFSPRKAAISLYVYSGSPDHDYLLKDLGKYTMGKACIYVKKLSDINIDVMKALMQASIDFVNERYKINPS